MVDAPDEMVDGHEGESLLTRTEAKNQVEALQTLGERLVDISDRDLRRVFDAAPSISDSLRDAVALARQIKSFKARRRQLQYIGRLMRTEAPEPIRAALLVIDKRSAASATHARIMERWCQRLQADEPDALCSLFEAYPQLDRQHINRLVRAARKGGPRQARVLFRELLRLR